VLNLGKMTVCTLENECSSQEIMNLIDLEITEQDKINLEDTLNFLRLEALKTPYNKRLYERLRETYQKIYDCWINEL